MPDDHLPVMAEEICPGFPDRCPNLRTMEPEPGVHLGGIRCGCADSAAVPAVVSPPTADQTGQQPQSCRSEEGITVGLVDAVIGIIRVLAPRDLSTGRVQEALADLLEDPDFQTLRHARNGPAQTGLRDRIAEVLRPHASLGGTPLRWEMPYFVGATPSLPRISGWRPLDEVADAVLPLLPATADRGADICICRHAKAQHSEDACLVCDCGDYLPPEAAREVIGRYQEADRLRRLAGEARQAVSSSSPELAATEFKESAENLNSDPGLRQDERPHRATCSSREPLLGVQCTKEAGHEHHSDRPGRIWYPVTDDEAEQPERPRCPHCNLPHDLTPGGLTEAACQSIRARITEAKRRHAAGDHGGCAAVDCETVRARREPQSRETCTNCGGSGLDPRYSTGDFDCPDCVPAVSSGQPDTDEESCL